MTRKKRSQRRRAKFESLPGLAVTFSHLGTPGCNYVAFEMAASITEWRRELINQAVWCTQLGLPSRPTESGLGLECLFPPQSCPEAPFWIGGEGCQWAILSFWVDTCFLAYSLCCQLPSLHPRMIRKLASDQMT